MLTIKMLFTEKKKKEINKHVSGTCHYMHTQSILN